MLIISTQVLLPLVALMLVMVVFAVETALYFSFNAWYYRTGPAVLRERWQTSGPVDQVRSAIRPSLRADGLVGRESREGFCIRQKTLGMNAWPRVLLRIEKSDRGAAISFEVRPYYTMALLIFPLAWLAAGAFGLGGFSAYLTVGVLVLVVGIYKWIMPWDLKRINRLPGIRRALASYGLRICENCGYDLFGHDDPPRCPECGRTSKS